MYPTPQSQPPTGWLFYFLLATAIVSLTALLVWLGARKDKTTQGDR